MAWPGDQEIIFG